MTNQRFVWRSWERRSQALSLLGCSLAANLHQAACMRYFLPPASIRARPAGLRAGGGQRHKADAALLCTTGVCWPAEPPLLNSARC